MDTIEHNGKTFNLEEVKKDFNFLFNLTEEHAMLYINEFNYEKRFRYNSTPLEKLIELSKLRFFKFIFCDSLDPHKRDETRPIYQAADICKKYVTIDPKIRARLAGLSENYSKAFRAFQNSVMLQIEDLIAAVGNPEWCQLFAKYIPNCNKSKLIKGAELNQ